MARVSKADRQYFGRLELRRGETVVDFTEEQTDSLPGLLACFFPSSDVARNVQQGRAREMRFDFARYGGEWPAPNFHTVARDLRLAPHKCDRIYGPSGGEVAYYVRLTITVNDTSALRSYRNSGFLEDDQIDRLARVLVGTKTDEGTAAQKLYPGLPLDLWREGISFAQFQRVIARDDSGVWAFLP